MENAHRWHLIPQLAKPYFTHWTNAYVAFFTFVQTVPLLRPWLPYEFIIAGSFALAEAIIRNSLDHKITFKPSDMDLWTTYPANKKLLQRLVYSFEQRCGFAVSEFELRKIGYAYKGIEGICGICDFHLHNTDSMSRELFDFLSRYKSSALTTMDLTESNAIFGNELCHASISTFVRQQLHSAMIRMTLNFLRRVLANRLWHMLWNTRSVHKHVWFLWRQGFASIKNEVSSSCNL